VELNTDEKKTIFRNFDKKDIEFANRVYAQLEKEIETQRSENRFVVLVAVKDVKTLKKAYPNYFLDSTEFIKLVKHVLSLSEQQTAH
jgi:putative GTP pyrophosphokinase